MRGDFDEDELDDEVEETPFEAFCREAREVAVAIAARANTQTNRPFDTERWPIDPKAPRTDV